MTIRDRGPEGRLRVDSGETTMSVFPHKEKTRLIIVCDDANLHDVEAVISEYREHLGIAQ